MPVIKTNTANFEKDVLQSDKPILLDFTAEWCGPCKALEPVLEKIASERDDIVIIKVDVDESKEIAEKYNVRSMPTLMIFNGGKKVSHFNQMRSERLLNEWIDQAKNNTEEKEFKADTKISDVVKKDDLNKFEKNFSFSKRLRSSIFPVAITIGGIALASAATGPIAVLAGIGAAVTGVHSVIKQGQQRKGFKKIFNLLRNDDQDGLINEAESFLENFNHNVYFGRNFAKGIVTATAGVMLVGASGGLALGVLGAVMAVYGSVGTIASTAGYVGTRIGIKALEKKLDEIDANADEKDTTSRAKKSETALNDSPAPSNDFNPAANQNKPAVRDKATSKIPAKKPAAKK